MLDIDAEEATGIIESFIREYVEKSGAKGVVIGLSGGIDSSLVVTLAARAIGNENVHAIFMPETSTPLEDFEHSRLIARKTGINYNTIDISSIVHSIVGDDKLDQVSLGNIKARVRMIYLYKYANLKNAIVCGTSNKTELLIGYFTKYGDGGADMMPLGDVYKTQVYKLAAYLDIPGEIIEKPPTAGLWKGQTDEKELGIKYEKLDIILYGIERDWKMEKIAMEAGVEVAEVKRIYDMVRRSEHKKRFPPIPKIGFHTIGIDWRFPLQLDDE